MLEGVTSQVPCVGTGDRSHQFVSELEDQVGDLHLRLVFGPSQEVLQEPQSPGDPQHCSTSHSPASSYPGAAKPGVLNLRFPIGGSQPQVLHQDLLHSPSPVSHLLLFH